jgi:hypothetical protein
LEAIMVEHRTGKGRVWIAAALALVASAGCSRGRANASVEPVGPDPTPREPPWVEPPPVEPPVNTRWSWPGSAAFRAREQAVQRMARSIRVASGRLSLRGRVRSGVVMAISPAADGTHGLWVEVQGDDADRYHLGYDDSWRLESGTLPNAGGPIDLTFSRHETELRVTGHLLPATRLARTVTAEWAYVAELLGDESVYDDAKPDPALDHAKEIETALARGDRERAIALHRSYRPMGRCSMDGHPAAVARSYAELCYQAGKLGCFLQLSVDIMGDRFQRIAYSRLGEAVHPTESARLLDTGLDVERFLRGLLLQYAGVTRRGELGAWRLARSVRETGKQDQLLASFARLAEDPSLDEYNRLRAAQVVWLVDASALEGARALTDASRAWIEEQRARR